MELTPVTQPTKSKLKRARLGRLEENHQAVWEALRARGAAHPRELARATGQHENKIGFYMAFLERAGYLWMEPGVRLRRFWLINNTGDLAPRRLRGGQNVADDNTGETYAVPDVFERWPGKPAPVGSPQFMLWKAMRMLRSFTVGELVMVTELDQAQVRERVDNLLQFDYLRTGKPSLGEPGYLLPKHRSDDGEKPPAINMQLGKLYSYKTKEIISIQV